MSKTRVVEETARVLGRLVYDQLNEKSLLSDPMEQVIVNAIYLAIRSNDEDIVRAKLRVFPTWPKPTVMIGETPKEKPQEAPEPETKKRGRPKKNNP